MGFLQNYLNNNRLDAMTDDIKKRLSELEYSLQTETPSDDFSVCLEKFGPEISDLVERVSAAIPTISLNGWKDYLGLGQFIWNIAVEVYQLMKEVSSCVVNDSMTPEQKKEAEVLFGKELIYFVWLAVNPLKGHFTWVPFKATIEKRLVMYCAEKALGSVVHLFAANASTVTTFGVGATNKLRGLA